MPRMDQPLLISKKDISFAALGTPSVFGRSPDGHLELERAAQGRRWRKLLQDPKEVENSEEDEETTCEAMKMVFQSFCVQFKSF